MHSCRSCNRVYPNKRKEIRKTRRKRKNWRFSPSFSIGTRTDFHLFVFLLPMDSPELLDAMKREKSVSTSMTWSWEKIHHNWVQIEDGYWFESSAVCLANWMNEFLVQMCVLYWSRCAKKKRQTRREFFLFPFAKRNWKPEEDRFIRETLFHFLVFPFCFIGMNRILSNFIRYTLNSTVDQENASCTAFYFNQPSK